MSPAGGAAAPAAAAPQVRRAPLAAWTVQERLWLVSAVERHGAQNWVTVARALRPLQQELQRPADWYDQRQCAAQYAALLERHEPATAIGRRRSAAAASAGAGEEPAPTPQELIRGRLAEERCDELRAQIAKNQRDYRRYKDEVRELLSPSIPEARLRGMAVIDDAAAVVAAAAATAAAAAKGAERARARPARPQATPQQQAPQPQQQNARRPDSSPLLTSLLRTAPPPAPPTPPKRPAQTPPRPQRKPSPAPDEREKIEQIKSELQKIERSFIEGSIVAQQRRQEQQQQQQQQQQPPPSSQKIDIDDIELKAEDVYTFSDIDLVIAPVSSMHKTPPKAQEKAATPKREPPPPQSPVRDERGESDVEPINKENEPPSAEKDERQPDDPTIKSESETATNAEIVNDAKLPEGPERVDLPQSVEKEVDSGIVTEVTFKQEPSELIEKSEDPTAGLSESNAETDDDAPIEVIKEDKPGKTKRDYSRKKSEKDERPNAIGEDEGISSKVELSDELCSDNSQESADKSKLMQKRLKQELCDSHSESPSTPTDSLPDSPAAQTPPVTSTNNPSEQDKEHRIWKKSVILTLTRLGQLKYASWFKSPIKDDDAPGYSQAVKRPMDLATIRRNIDAGATRTTREFQRDVLLMFTNALMYNHSKHEVFAMAGYMMREAIAEFELLLLAQSADDAPNVSRHMRLGRPASRTAPGPPTIKRKRGNASTSSPAADTPPPQPSKKRKTDEA